MQRGVAMPRESRGQVNGGLERRFSKWRAVQRHQHLEWMLWIVLLGDALQLGDVLFTEHQHRRLAESRHFFSNTAQQPASWLGMSMTAYDDEIEYATGNHRQNLFSHKPFQCQGFRA